MTALLQVRGLQKRFGGVHALRGLDMEVQAGTITALIGPNGAGKTTAFACISGVLHPTAGAVSLDGQDVTGWRPDRITRAGLVRTFQLAQGIGRLSVLDNLMLYAPALPRTRLWPAVAGTGRHAEVEALEQAWAVARQLGLGRVANAAAGALSGGQKKLLEIGRALMARPRLILLDEPVAGVNPTLAEEIADRLHQLRSDGMTFLVIEHRMDLIARLCDPVIVMAEGRQLISGRFSEVAADRRVQDSYMGRRH